MAPVRGTSPLFHPHQQYPQWASVSSKAFCYEAKTMEAISWSTFIIRLSFRSPSHLVHADEER